MADKYKKIDRRYVLSDSSVNEYGFRLLTSGYQLDVFRNNPIGYYMHRREDGVVLKWEDLRVEGDQIVGTPVINLTNPRGAQTCDEAANGFLNAASVGHIVVLDYSKDKDLMLPGQTGPTITRWYNKECSLVDIPGNGNALSKLYDAQENEINLLDLKIGTSAVTAFGNNLVAELKHTLELANEADENAVLSAVQSLAEKAGWLQVDNKRLEKEKNALQLLLDETRNAHNRQEINTLLDRALEDKKINVALKSQLAIDYATNPEGLKSLLSSMLAYRSITDTLRAKEQEKTDEQWEWEDYEKNDPTGQKLKELKANEPERYKALFDKKFNRPVDSYYSNLK